ncbi:glycosyltransferase family 4 protein [Spirosoma utsteinense]|uniref:Glycosyltransferase involved in cell wall biosynthesis n=1 Tax=Spirosoma utsteinense TaxID=2585773 RepID=A0ABR6W2E9_9BACT|nr:glycosyltransferase family 4 protein [Spirosoma utsteinense]MBC3785104.1 glycosyltransferase involved in cell wall biosynthesis [Spirosoma utsteinense]MBC3790286.1 glycosyltransferase involved in cell wall biosynthesis [Spirosoma utsteinense]
MTNRLLLFDMNPTGHHAGYMHHLIRYWHMWDIAGELIVVVSPAFLTMHPGLVALAQDAPTVHLVVISDAEEAHRISRGRLVFQMQYEWELVTQYARQWQVNQILLMYFDTFQMAFGLAQRLPCPVAGIFFRPVFHYEAWGHPPANSREKLQGWRKRQLIRLVVRRRSLKALFCLDPFVVQPLNQWAGRQVAAYLPDPVEVYPATDAEAVMLRNKLGIEPTRQVMLVFGQLDERKGLFTLVDALKRLSPDQQARWCLLLVGPVDDRIAPALATSLDTLTADTAVQLVRQHSFVSETAIQPYFSLSDLVITLYQRHIGMSAVLVRAAAAGKPVLSSDYGLMGQLVKTRQLGQVINAESPTAVADALVTFGQKSWPSNLGAMTCFAEQNQASQYARTIFDTLGWQSAR